MNLEYEPVYYLVYSPSIAGYLLKVNPEPNFYLQYGYYISGCYPMECEDGIVFGGSYKNCINVAVGLCHFSMN